jgi:hypothetical protein
MVVVAAVLCVAALISTARMLWPSAPAPAPAVVQTIAASVPRPVIRTSSGKLVSHSEPRLDPTLDLDLLRQSEQIKYAGTGRNIFVEGSEPVIPKPIRPGTPDPAKLSTPVIPPPPPITLKFYGYASKPGEPKKIFLSQGDDIFVASEGDIVDRRYRILHITPTSVDVEDVLNNNRQSIPLTQG